MPETTGTESYRERAARISTWVALVLFALLVPWNFMRERPGVATADGIVSVILLGHVLLMRRVNRPLLSALVTIAVFVAMVLPNALDGRVQGYFWADAAPPLIFFFAGTRRGAWLSGGLFAALLALLVLVPPQHVAAGVELSIVVSFLIVVLFGFINEGQRLRYEAELLRLSDTDALTELANRRRFHALLDMEHERARRYQRAYALMVVDVDQFKQVNDRFGHDGGDAALKAVAARLVDGARSTDTVARFGGDEFAVLCPETNLADATALADRLRAAVIGDETCARMGVTLTIGLAAVRPGDDLSNVLKRADEALYGGKAAGRNRVLAG